MTGVAGGAWRYTSKLIDGCWVKVWKWYDVVGQAERPVHLAIECVKAGLVLGPIVLASPSLPIPPSPPVLLQPAGWTSPAWPFIGGPFQSYFPGPVEAYGFSAPSRSGNSGSEGAGFSGLGGGGYIGGGLLSASRQPGTYRHLIRYDRSGEGGEWVKTEILEHLPDSPPGSPPAETVTIPERAPPGASPPPELTPPTMPPPDLILPPGGDTPAPEPGSLALLGAGLLILWLRNALRNKP